MKRMLATAAAVLMLGMASAAPLGAQTPAKDPAASAKPTTTAKPTTAAPPAATTAATPKAKRPASAGMTAARERQKKCGAEWREAKAAGTITKGQKWPQYWSACNKRLKAQGT